MKIPKHIQIGLKNYEIRLIDERRDEQGKLLDGEIDFTNRIIYIDQSLHQDDQVITFLHEIIHGIFEDYCRSNWRDNEDLIDTIAKGLFKLMLDNPKLFTQKG